MEQFVADLQTRVQTLKNAGISPTLAILQVGEDPSAANYQASIVRRADMVGVAVKVFLNYTLIGMPDINIYGAPIASLTCYTLSMLPNLYFVYKYTGMKPEVMKVFGRPAAATALMAGVLYLSMKLLPSYGVWTLVQIVIAVAAYAAAAVVTGALTKDELAPVLRRFGRRGAKRKGE